MKVQRCKGSRDLSPDEMRRFRLIESDFRDYCLKWGYDEVRTPTLEYLHLFTSGGTLTPDLLSKIYSFLDWDGWSGERVVLRPDGTIPVARLYIESVRDKLARLFYVANVFIFESTGKKTRERWQCGAELIGTDSPYGDVELIALALGILERLRFEGVELRLSHAGIMKAILVKLGLSPAAQTKLFGQILGGDIEALTRVKPGKPELEKAILSLLNLKGKSSKFLKNMKALFTHDLPELGPPLDNFICIVELLEALGCNYQIDVTSGRGFEYYTGVIFQFFVNGEEVGGGGRYNDLITQMGGCDAPASGFALYLDRLMNLLVPAALAEPMVQKIRVRAEPEMMKEGFNTANCLRDAGYVTELSFGDEELADLNLILDVQNGTPRFTLTDQFKRRTLKLKTVAEVLAVLGEEGVDKDSIA